MRFLLALLTITLLPIAIANPVLAIPNCSQINDTWCDIYCNGEDAGYIYWMTTCDPVTRWWQCICWDGTPGPSVGGECWCPNYEHEGCDCLLEGTLISMADGSEKPVESIQPGDYVLAYDESARSFVESEVVSIHEPYEIDHYYVINDVIRITENHPVLIDGQWINVSKLREGDAMTTVGRANSLIASIELIKKKAIAYNIQVADHTYVAGGIVVHNKEDCEDLTPKP